VHWIDHGIRIDHGAGVDGGPGGRAQLRFHNWVTRAK
jgi:hypothetical protein